MSDHLVTSLLRDLVRIPSFSRDETKAADRVQAFFDEHQVDVTRKGDNVVASIGDGPTSLLMCSHLDTVPPSEDHPFGPFDATVHEGWMHGRGTVDAKASVAAMSSALAQLQMEGWAPGCGKLVAAFTVCEETGGEDNGLEVILPNLRPINSALVGEPTEMQPCTAQKGLLILRMISKGIAAHAARPETGRNAITQMAQDLSVLSKLEFERLHPLLGITTLEPTMVKGGVARNVIPELCEVFLDIRSTPVYSHSELVALVQGEVDSRIEIHSDRMVPIDTDSEASIVSACLAAIPGSRTFGSPTMSDWIYLQDIPTVKLGPGSSSYSHTAEERIELSYLEAAPTMYKNTIVGFFQNLCQ